MMADNETYIWDELRKAGYSEIQTAGIMGNLMMESGLRPNNLQNVFEKKFGLTDQQYTDKVNSGEISCTNFYSDGAGYGLAQWTYWSRKKALYAKCYPDIGGLQKQVAYMISELAGFPTVQKRLPECTTIRQVTEVIMKFYEMPADQSNAALTTRTNYGQQIYDRHHKPEPVITNWYACQCAAFGSETAALSILNNMSSEYHCYKSGKWYQIALGQYATYNEALKHLPEAKKQRSDAFIGQFKAENLIR